MSCLLGMDIGGTSLKLGAWDNGKRLAWEDFIALPGSGEDSVVKEFFCTTIKNFCANHEINPSGLGIGSCGLISGGTIFQSPNTPWDRLPLVQMLKDEYQFPIFLINDADAFLVQTLTTLPDTRAIVLGITLGTGIGTGLWITDRLFAGGAGISPEGGHITIKVDGAMSTSGISGTWESLANRDAVMRYYAEAGGQSATSPLEVSNEAADSKAEALVAWNRFGRMVGAGLGSLCNVLSPDYVMIGGGLSGAKEWFEAPMMLGLERNLLKAMPRPDIHFFDHDPDLVAKGAMRFAAQMMHYGQ